MDRERLIAFERRVADAFAAKRIRAPIHLCSDDQAEPLIQIFKEIRPTDWVCLTWRNHMHCLLKGMPEDELFKAIVDGRSMFVCSRKHRIVSSAIVAGILPLACGLAFGIKQRGGTEQVHCFVGDMGARTGLYHEFQQFCRGHALPVRIVIEDNHLSTNASTEDTWGRATAPLSIQRYEYERNYPHCGLNQFIAF